MSCLDVQDSAEFRTADDIFIKEMNLKDAGMVVRQHSHKYGHTTLLAHGKLRAWRDDGQVAEYSAPASIYIPANTKHAFMSLVPDTIAYCIHRLEPGADVEIAAEHTQEDVEKLLAA